MTPSLFEGTDARDEYEFMRTSGAIKKVREHRRTFITEADFAWLHKHGINAVRVPVGYWIIDGDEPFCSGITRLDWAVRMAEKYDIALLICLHAAPGSQNGNDHSGRAGRARWYDDPLYRRRTIDVLATLAARYRTKPSVWGIELLNEPLAKFWQPTLRAFYQQAYHAITRAGRPGLEVVFSDAYTPRLLSGVLGGSRDFPVVMDHHWYHFFIPGWLQAKLPLEWYFRYLAHKRALLERLSRAQPIIIGEWNGVIGGEKLNQYPPQEHAAIVDEHIRRQLAAFSTCRGWFYWSYKHEHGGVFDFRDMVEHERIVL